MKRKICGIIISVLMVLTMIPLQSFGAGVPFKDVPMNIWYYNDVKMAYETGLINGYEDNTFRPDSNMTYAQAVKLAACMNQKYITGSVSLGNGIKNWWDSYVEYAKKHNIISKDYDWNSNATRAGYVEIFAKALPDVALKAKNIIPDDSIPDVKMSHPQAAAIYKLYRASILTGTDENAKFEPDNYIRRSEVSAILTRMMNEDARKDLSLATPVTPSEPEQPTPTTPSEPEQPDASLVNLSSKIIDYIKKAMDHEKSASSKLSFAVGAVGSGLTDATWAQGYYIDAELDVLKAIELCGNYTVFSDTKESLKRIDSSLTDIIGYSLTVDNCKSFASETMRNSNSRTQEYLNAIRKLDANFTY